MNNLKWVLKLLWAISEFTSLKNGMEIQLNPGNSCLDTIAEILLDKNKCLEFLFDKGIFYTERECPKSELPMKLYMVKITW